MVFGVLLNQVFNIFERHTTFGIDDRFAFFKETAVVIEILGNEVTRIGNDVLRIFGVVMRRKADNLLELSKRVFDMILIFSLKVLRPFIGKLRVVLIFCLFMIIVTNRNITGRDFLVSLDKTDGIR